MDDIDPDHVALPPDQSPEVRRLCTELFEKLSEYLQGELAMTSEDYRLLEHMNRITKDKYENMTEVAKQVGTSLHQLNDKYRNLKPYLEQIDQLDAAVTDLENTAYQLDAYSKKLEARFKSLEKK
ncbi:PREDICTED: biogenesis of lysosome-related organelles complex 1 subunit 2-like [Priapulus caudatus]|uniref:Biogenesis of lysosome-related organelles complex 1 subunit 2-like n=1 Tax=Priapulus caudatus TaxID=37621 RepID=A0ABM1E6F8_PRICU|nr:PREDICTED: biogenesis of lysosome-related organelles complex 1 subunit 2-like [Priapulus caudatus]